LPIGADLDSVRTTWRVRAPSSVSVAVHTRKGAVVARGVTGDLEIDGGSGGIDARMAGGAARLSTTSGSGLLRGDYPLADVKSSGGRIDVQAPPRAAAQVDLRIASDRGGVWLDLRRGQLFAFEFHGELRQVECDPEVRLEWQQVVDRDGVEYNYGRLGNLLATAKGRVQLDAGGPVRVRLQPDGDPGRAAGTR